MRRLSCAGPRRSSAGAPRGRRGVSCLSLSLTATLLPSPSAANQPHPPHTNQLQGILLKLSRSGDDGDKAFLLLEPGSRFHLTSEPPERPDVVAGGGLDDAALAALVALVSRAPPALR